MTSLGSVCREKITAAANQLNVDTEIVKVTNFTEGAVDDSSLKANGCVQAASKSDFFQIRSFLSRKLSHKAILNQIGSTLPTTFCRV